MGITAYVTSAIKKRTRYCYKIFSSMFYSDMRGAESNTKVNFNDLSNTFFRISGYIIL